MAIWRLDPLLIGDYMVSGGIATVISLISACCNVDENRIQQCVAAHIVQC